MLHRRLITDDQPRVLLDAPLKASLALSRGVGAYTYSRASTATVMGYSSAANSGDSQVLLSVGSGEPRFQGARYLGSGLWSDKFADGTPIPESTLLGYLSEGSRTNLCLYSEQFDNAAWTKTNVTVSANSVVAPNGNTSANSASNTVGANSYVYQNISLSNSTTYTRSVYAKHVTGTGVIALEINTGTGGNAAIFDVSTGTVVSSGGMPCAVTAASNGFYRCSVTFTTAATGTPAGGVIYIGAYGATATPTTIALWGAQIEQASFASTYIQTTSASVTRAADSLSYQANNNINKDARGAVYMESWINPASAYLTQVHFGVSESPLMVAPGNYTYSWDGTTQFNGPSVTVGSVSKIASTWGLGGRAVSANGAITLGGAYDGSFGAGSIYVGTDNSTSQSYGNHKNVRIYDRAFSPAQLAALTR